MEDSMFNDNDTTLMRVGWNAKYSPQNKTTRENMVPPTNQPAFSISSRRDNQDIIKDSITRSKRKYYRDVRFCYSKISIVNSSWRKADDILWNYYFTRMFSSRNGYFFCPFFCPWKNHWRIRWSSYSGWL